MFTCVILGSNLIDQSTMRASLEISDLLGIRDPSLTSILILFLPSLHSNQRCWWNKRMDRGKESSIKYRQLWTWLGQCAGSTAQTWRLWEGLGSSWRQGEIERTKPKAFFLSSRNDWTVEKILLVFIVFISLSLILGEFSWWNCPASDSVTSRICWGSPRKMYWVESGLE